MPASSPSLVRMAQLGCRGMGGARVMEGLYHGNRGSRNVKIKLATRNMLIPGHGQGCDL